MSDATTCPVCNRPKCIGQVGEWPCDAVLNGSRLPECHGCDHAAAIATNETLRRYDLMPCDPCCKEYCDAEMQESADGTYMIAADVDAALAAKDAIIQHYAEGVERLTPLANIGRLAVAERQSSSQEWQTAQDRTSDAVRAYLAAQRETEEKK